MKPDLQNKHLMICCNTISPRLERVEGQPVALWRCVVCEKLALQVLATLSKSGVDNQKAERVEIERDPDPLLQAYYRMLDRSNED